MDTKIYTGFVLNKAFVEENHLHQRFTRSVLGFIAEYRELELNPDDLGERGDVVFWWFALHGLFPNHFLTDKDEIEDATVYQLADLAEKYTRSERIRPVEKREKDLDQFFNVLDNLFFQVIDYREVYTLMCMNHEKLTARHKNHG